MTDIKLILFDIDGTIILTKGAGRRVLEEAINEVMGKETDASQIRFSGKTDLQIVREILEFNGVDPSSLHDLRSRILDLYAANFSVEELLPTLEILPGIKELIERLSEDPAFKIGLLTGNLEHTAWLKIDAAQIDRSYFDVGGYGSDSEDRYEIPKIVQEKASAFYGQPINGSQLVIIGDTEHDINCGKSIAAKSVGVATGHYTFDELHSHQPDLVYQNFANVDTVHSDLRNL